MLTLNLVNGQGVVNTLHKTSSTDGVLSISYIEPFQPAECCKYPTLNLVNRQSADNPLPEITLRNRGDKATLGELYAYWLGGERERD